MSSVAQYLVGPPRYKGSTIATCYLSRESTGVNKYSLYSRAEDVGRPLLLLYMRVGKRKKGILFL